MLKYLGKLEAALTAGLAVLIIACLCCGAMQEGVAEKVLRLHIIANSDSAEDQALKLLVRDELLDYVRELTEGAEGIEDAKRRVEAAGAQLSAAARAAVARAGYDYGVRLYLDAADFPAKTYGGVTLPAGSYSAVNVILGEGGGQNWWCVMYPALCTSEAPDKELRDSDISEEELKFISSDNKYELRFRLVEWYLKLKALFKSL